MLDFLNLDGGESKILKPPKPEVFVTVNFLEM